MREKREELDLLIDSALSSYGDPGPDAGLEQRILARVTASQTFTKLKPSHRRRWFWLLAIPAFASLLFFIAMPKTPQHESKEPKQPYQIERPAVITSQTAQPAPSAFKTAHRFDAPALIARHSRPESTSQQPKLDVFPTPRPLSPDEQALVAFATQTPEPQQQAVARVPSRTAPLTIAAIQITPIEPARSGQD